MRRLVLGFSLLVVTAGGLACSGSSPAGGSGGQPGGGSGGSAGAGTGGSAGAGTGGMPYTMEGACIETAMATATTTTYEGTDTYALRDQGGLGVDICQVKFDVKRVAAAPAGCPGCLWSHQVELSNPMTLTDQNGACAKSDLGFSMTKINSLDGSRISIGFVEEFEGAHASVVLKYSDETATWKRHSYATWDETSHAFRFENRYGACNY
jgi:hypothetical protein